MFAELPTALSEDLQELKQYEFDVGLWQRTEDEELQRTRLTALKQQQQRVYEITFAKLKELEIFEGADNVKSAIEDLIKIEVGLLGIKL